MGRRKIAAAVASFQGQGTLGPERAAAIETAMVEALKKAQKAGVSDSKALRKVQLDARDEVLKRRI